MTRKALLVCGILSSVLYAVMTIVGAMLYEGYSSASQVVSELSAVGAPTRQLWVWLGAVYSLLVVAFGWGVWKSAGTNRRLRIAGASICFGFAVTGIAWPFAPMHVREVLAAGGGTLSDTVHIILGPVTIFLLLFTIGFAAVAFGKPFRFYSMITIAIILVSGILMGLDGPRIAANLPTPWVGVWQRITIGAYLLWFAVLAIALLRLQHTEAVTGRRDSRQPNDMAA
jgi:hypothetical protein